MYMEMPVIPVNKVVDPKRIIRKNGGLRRKRHKGSLTKKSPFKPKSCVFTIKS
jgi:hypothetical protein